MNQPDVHYESAPWQVSIRPAPDQLPVGGGMYCADGHVLTCAHVVADSDERPDGLVYVTFQHLGEHEPIPAVVTDRGWSPPEGKGRLDGDVAVLRLTEPAPAGAAGPPLLRAPEGVRVPHAFHAYGYPAEHAEAGVPARGKIVGRAERQWVSLLTDEGGQGLDPGFSGSPVWDVDLGGVVGIVVLRDVPWSSSDRGGFADTRRGYAIRMEVLGTYWPALQRDVGRTLSGDGEPLEDLLEVGLTTDGELPAVGDTPVYHMGVTPSKYVTADNPRPPYVSRRLVDEEIEQLLGAGERFIVAVGDSKSGKSRSFAEMLHRLRPQARLIVPAVDDPATLSKLARRRLPLGPEGGVLWLDDIDRYLVPNGLSHKILNSFLTWDPPVVIAGTITSHRYQDIMAPIRGNGARDATAQFGRVLSEAKLVRVASTLSPEDLAEARERYPDEDFGKRGIGEQMVAAEMVEQLYGAAREGFPEGWAVIQAAIDWRRIGVSRPVSRPVLRNLFRSYLAEVTPHLEPGEDLFAAGLHWASDPLVGTIALLTTVDPAQAAATYRAFDYVLACADGQGPFQRTPIAASAWEVAIAVLDAEELLVVTQAAVTQGEIGFARRAAEAARRDSADPAAVARATLLLGELHAASDQLGTAIDLLEEAAASGVIDIVATAQADLGTLLSLPGGEPDRARALLQSAIDAGDAQVTAQAQLSLGVMLMNQGALAEARPLLEAAMAVGVDMADSTFVGLTRMGSLPSRLPRKDASLAGRQETARTSAAPVTDDRTRVLQAAEVRRAESVKLRAQASLGGLLVNEGDLPRAQMLLEAALASGNREVEPLARTNLGALLMRNGDTQAAREEFERVINSDQPDFACNARLTLGTVLVATGENEEGYALLEAAASSGIVEQVPLALCLLAEFSYDRGEKQAAHEYFERAVQTGHRNWAPYAQVDMGLVRAYEGDIAGARELLDPIIESRHPTESARAADLMGDVLLGAGEISAAEEAYHRAIGLEQPLWSAVAMTDLAELRAQQGAIEEATRLLQSVIDGGDPNLGPMAADKLGTMLLAQAEDIEGARAAYQQAIDSGHADWSVVARFNLTQLLDGIEDTTGAKEQLRAVIDGPNRAYAAKAWDLLGDLLAESGDVVQAQAAYQQAIDSKVDDWSAQAQLDLARLILAESDDADQAEPLLTAATAGGSSDVAGAAWLLLGLVSLFREEPGHAEERFQHAAETGPARVAEPALMQIAKLKLDQGHLEEASGILERLVDESADESLVLYATAHLGVVRLRQDDVTSALELLERGADSEDPDTAAYACLNWGLILFDLDYLEDAADILTRALEAGENEVRSAARAGLGAVRLAQGRLEEARALLTEALDDGNPEDEPSVRRYLGSVLARQGNSDEARAVLEPLADLDDTDDRPAGLLLLGRLAVQSGDRAASRRWLEMAVGAGDEEVEAYARVELGRLLTESGDLSGSRGFLTPLLDRHDDQGEQARRMVAQLDAGAPITPPGLPPGRQTDPAPLALPPGRPLAIRPSRGPESGPRSSQPPLATPPLGGEAAVAQPPPVSAPSVPAASGSTSIPLVSLPRAVLARLADIADIERQPAEARYWRDLLAGLPGSEGAEPSAAAGGHGAEGGDHGVPGAVGGPDHEGART